MAETGMQRLSLEDTKRSARLLENMIEEKDLILAKDVITEDGTVLAAKDMMIDFQTYNKIKKFGIEKIYIKANPQPKVKTQQKIQSLNIPEQQEFRKFEAVYEQKADQTKAQLMAISNGGAVNLDQLSSITGDILDTLEMKRDVFTYLTFLKERDEHTFTHCNNVSLLCNVFAQWLKLDKRNTVLLTTAGLLHDLGKTKIPDEILNKKGPLSETEFDKIKEHPLQGYRILQGQYIPEEVKLAALMHHEKMDGSGYPSGARMDQINWLSRIVAICDIYDAMTANRVYRAKLCPFDVIRTFETQSYGELDTQYLMIFLENIADNYLHSYVKLSNNENAIVEFINKRDLSRPVVRVANGEFLDLSMNKDISILEII